jgi:opacity protein-like surface antigen
MKWSMASLILASSVLATGTAYAQEPTPGPGVVEVSVIPGGATFVTSKGDAPDFQNYDAGAALGYNFSRIVGVEGEVTGSFGLKQNVGLFSLGGEEKTPNLLSYTGNVVVMLPGHSWAPYVTGGIGGTTLYQREILGILNTDTFFTSNVGGGVKWYFGDRWGVRGDYRFIAVNSKDNAPEFFGADDRFSHRIYGAVVINVVK